MAFCGTCGTQLYGTGTEEGAPLSVRVSTMAQRRELAPIAQVWCRSRLDWVSDLASLPEVETQ